MKKNYITPSILVVEVVNQQIICGSISSIDDMLDEFEFDTDDEEYTGPMYAPGRVNLFD